MTNTDQQAGNAGPGNVPAVNTAQTVDVIDSEVFQRFLAAADDPANEVDPDQVTIDIIGRILKAASVDDVLGGAGATHARDVRFNRSDFGDSGPAFYALLSGADTNGEAVTITCGARNVIAQAWKLRDMNALPCQVELAESDRPTRAGFKVMWLQHATKGF
jgi:hypothetical protein